MVTNVTQPSSGASNGAKETYVPPSIEELSADDPRVVAMMRARLADLLIVEQAAKRLQAFALDGPTPEKLGAARELDEALATSDKNRAALST